MRRIIENSEPMQEPVLLEKTFIHQSQEDEHYKIDAFLSSHQEDLQIPALVRFTARIDLETDTTIWEIKCTSSLTMEHYLQVVIYAWLWKMTQSEIAQKKQFKLFNIKTGQVLRLSATDEQLDFIVLSILKGKYQVPVPMTDEIFLAKMEDCHRTYS
jgi:hypothetical protein